MGNAFVFLIVHVVTDARLPIYATTIIRWCDQSKGCAPFLNVRDEMGLII
jgi:hypothetical protein